MKVRKIVSLVTALIMTLLLLAGCGGGTTASANIPQMDTLKETKASDITRIDFQRYTEGGAYQNTVYDLPTIEDIYLRLTAIEVKGETKSGVEDNGLNLTVVTADGETKFSFEGDILVQDDGKRYEAEGVDSLMSYIDRLAEQMGDSGKVTNGGGTGSTGSTGGSGTVKTTGNYDIMDGFEKRPDGSLVYIYFNDFMMVMPNNEKYSFEASPDKQSVTFYLFSAQQEGYGGRLVTIHAYDINDDSYTILPSYSVAGVGGNTNKRFVAEFPTDVQWNHEDATQEADYRELYDHVHKIAEGMANSPLYTADSNPEPSN